jgi:hypothetical protein
MEAVLAKNAAGGCAAAIVCDQCYTKGRGHRCAEKPCFRGEAGIAERCSSPRGKHVHHQPDHGVLLRRVGLGHQQGEYGETDVVDDRYTIVVEQASVTVEEVDKEEGTATLVAVSEWMVLDDEVEQMGRLGFDAGIGRFAENGLVK